MDDLKGIPAFVRAAETPSDPPAHACVRYRFATTGRLQPWAPAENGAEPAQPRTALTGNNMEALRGAVIVGGGGIRYVPDFLVRGAVQARVTRGRVTRRPGLASCP